MQIIKYLPTNTLRRSGQKLLSVKFGVAHDTGNINSTAMQNVEYYIRTANQEEASAHVFIDDLNIIQCIPLDEVAYHVRKAPTVADTLFGCKANYNALAVELCYFDDPERSKRAYTQYVEYWKGICAKYKLDPLKQVVGHYELDPERRTDPMNAFKRIGVSWAQFIKDLTPQTPTVDKLLIKEQIIKLLNQL